MLFTYCAPEWKNYSFRAFEMPLCVLTFLLLLLLTPRRSCLLHRLSELSNYVLFITIKLSFIGSNPALAINKNHLPLITAL